MKQSNYIKGFTILPVLILVVVFAVGGFAYFQTKNKKQQVTNDSNVVAIEQDEAISVNDQPQQNLIVSCSNNPNNYDYIVTVNDAQNAEISLVGGQKNVSLGTFEVEACQDIKPFLITISPDVDLQILSGIQAAIKDFTNIKVTSDSKTFTGTAQGLVGVTISNFTMSKGLKQTFNLSGDIISNPGAVSGKIKIVFAANLVTPKYNGQTTSTVATNNIKDAGGSIALKHFSISGTNPLPSDCADSSPNVVITSPVITLSTSLKYSVGSLLNLTWISCNLQSGVVYKVVLGNPEIGNGTKTLWEGTSTSASIKFEGPLDKLMNVIEIQAYQDSNEITLKKDISHLLIFTSD